MLILPRISEVSNGAQKVYKLKLQNTNLLLPNSWENVTENSCVYTDDVELQWLGEEGINIHRTSVWDINDPPSVTT